MTFNPIEKILGKKPKKDKYSKNDAYSKEYVDYDKAQQQLERQKRETWKDWEGEQSNNPRKKKAK